MIDDELLKQIVDKIFQLTNPAIDISRRPQVNDFIKSTINGDIPKSHLVINSGLRKDRKGVLVYTLTNARLLKIEIDDKEIQSSSIVLSSITNLERELEGDRALVKIHFQNEFIGLR